MRSLALVFLLLVPIAAAAQTPVAAGKVSVVDGPAFITRGAQTRPAAIGDALFESDRISTGDNGRLGVTLSDQTRLSIGPSSELQLSTFAYAPTQGRLALTVKMMRGLAVYVSGRIAALAPQSVQLETPNAIVGVRGTTVALEVAP